MVVQPSIVHQDSPHNAEPPLELLLDHFYTPLSLAFQRNHASFPEEGFAQTWRLEVGIEEAVACQWGLQDKLQSPMDGPGKLGGAVERRLWEGRLEELKGSGGEERRLRAILQCAGNRRDELSLQRKTQGVQWSSGTLANILWTGISLRSIFRSLGLPSSAPETLHVHFESDVGPCEEDSWYGSSLPLNEIISEDAAPYLLAFVANGESLPVRHGGPLRLVTPGKIGARSIKWIQRIVIRSYPSTNHYQLLDYKVLPPELTDPTPAERDAAMLRTAPMSDWDLNLVLGEPRPLSSSTVKIRGYAVGAHGIPLDKVWLAFVPRRSDDCAVPQSEVRSRAAELSKSEWREGDLQRSEAPEGDGGDEGADGSREWGWVLFRANIGIEEKGRGWVVGRCADREGNEQVCETQWNVRGVGMCGWGVKEVDLSMTEEIASD